MSGFKSSALVISEKDSPVAPQNPGEVTVVARDGKLYKYDGTTETEIGAGGDTSGFISFSEVANISGGFVQKTGDTMTGKLSLQLGVTTDNLSLGNERFGNDALLNITSGANSNTAVGSQAGFSITTGDGNTAIGNSALRTTTGSTFNTAVGTQALYYDNNGAYNTAVGSNALLNVVNNNYNTAVGADAGRNNTGEKNTFVGVNAGYTQGNVSGTVAIGYDALKLNTVVGNTAVGHKALSGNTTGSQNNSFGNESLYANTTGNNNCAFGSSSLRYNTEADDNVAVGNFSLYNNTTGDDNTAVGSESLYSNTTGIDNVAIGRAALELNSTGSYNTATGHLALRNNTTYSNCSGIGYNSQVTGSDQIQLGDSATTTYVYGTVQNRSDSRDKTAIRDTVLGLDFVMKLRPVDFKWDYREDYIDYIITEDISGGKTIETVETPKDGSKARSRYHHGVIAQEVAQVIDQTGIDFGGYQDHTIAGGQDVKSIGYDELIAPLIKAIQEQQATILDLQSRLQALEEA